MPGPGAKIHLVESTGHCHISTAAGARNGGGRFCRPLSRACINRINRLARKPGGKAFRLSLPSFAEVNAIEASSQYFGVVRRMAHKKKYCCHGRLRTGSHPAPPMKRKVSSRAAASVNCCGGDFMK